jgi:hypothetical protein
MSNSDYDSGSIGFRRRARGDLFYRLSYNIGKSIDDSSVYTYAAPVDIRNMKLERGRSDFDRHHAATGSFSWQLPVGRGKRLLRDSGRWTNAALGGWQLTGILTAYSGPPFTVVSSGVLTALGESSRPNRMATGTLAEGSHGGRRGVDYAWFDVTAFEAVPPCDTPKTCPASPHGFQPFAPGNSGRNILDGSGKWAFNAGLMKNFRPREGHTLQFRYELFNALNHPNFGQPNATFDSVTGGTITSTSGVPRQMQFALRYEF